MLDPVTILFNALQSLLIAHEIKPKLLTIACRALHFWLLPSCLISSRATLYLGPQIVASEPLSIHCSHFWVPAHAVPSAWKTLSKVPTWLAFLIIQVSTHMVSRKSQHSIDENNTVLPSVGQRYVS